MSMRKPAPSRRSLRPLAESLETRQLLSSLSTVVSATVSGTDTKGDRWTLTLYGPGTLNVVDKNGNAFTPANQFTPDDINTITVSGTITAESRLVGKVTYVPANSDGRVFFQQLTINNTGEYGQLNPALVRPRASTPQNGIAAVDMPDFWLGETTGEAPPATATSNFHTVQVINPQTGLLTSATPFFLAGGINAPEGINVLRFGGVDTTFTEPATASLPAGGTPLDQTNQNNEFVINLGPPIVGGTSIIVNKVITGAGSSTTSPGTTVQQSVTFVVAGRINLFQANEIDGDTAAGMVPTQFTPPSAQPQTNLLAGGTYLVSDVLAGSGLTTGQIGDIRIGGNATNFTAMALATDTFTQPTPVSAVDPDLVTGPQVSNFFIGGQTDNVILVAPSGSRNVFFGQGMDNVFINTEFIQNLQANRGAVGSAVTVKRNIGNMVMGGDVINTFIQSGYTQFLSAVANSPVTSRSDQSIPATGVFNGQAPPTIMNRISNVQNNLPTFSPLAHGGGEIHGRIAGNVTNSIISVSVDPNPSGIDNPGQFQNVTSKTFPFGAPNNIVLPRGVLTVKVEGAVNNSGLQQGSSPLVDPNVAPTSAFFAKKVSVEHLPVIPPNVPEAPYKSPVLYGNGQRSLKGLFKKDNSVTLPSRPAQEINRSARRVGRGVRGAAPSSGHFSGCPIRRVRRYHDDNTHPGTGRRGPLRRRAHGPRPASSQVRSR